MTKDDKNKVRKVVDKALEKIGLDPAVVYVNKYKRRNIEGYEISIPDYMFKSLQRSDRNKFQDYVKKNLSDAK